MESISQFRYFLKKFLKFIVSVSIILFINRYISEKSHNINTYNYNRAILYFFFLYLAIFISDIMTIESDFVSRLMYYFISCILTIYLSQWFLFKYSYKGFWSTFLKSMGATVLIGIIFIIAFYYGIYGQGEKIRDSVFLQYNYADYLNSDSLYIMTIFFPVLGILFWLTSKNSKLSNYLNQNIMAFMAIIIIIYIGLSFAIKIKALNSKQILNTYFTYLCICYVISVLQTYFVIDSVHNTCYGFSSPKQEKEKNAVSELYINLLLLSIIILLILNDIRKWSFFNYASYLLITIFVFSCLFSLSTKYPSITIFSLWSFIEWAILSAYNSHDTGNSFHYVMMNHKYNLSALNKEKEGTT